MMDSKETLYAYLAGAIDADGYISIQRAKRKRYKHHYYCPIMGFTGTGKPLVQTILKETFGGGVYRYVPKNRKHKPWHQWQTSGNDRVHQILQKLKPYLITKQEQAMLVLEFIGIARQQWKEIKNTQKPPYQVTKIMLEKREECWAKVALLNSPRNRRGGQSDAEKILNG